MSAHIIRLLPSNEVSLHRDALIDLLLDAVDAGASVNFVWPMTRDKARKWWDGALRNLNDRLIFVAERDGRVDGTVQLVMAPQENQPHRADLAKMLVHRRARRQGVGSALLLAAEVEAKRLGRTLLTLDTEKDGDGERLYARAGWIKMGEIPAYAYRADITAPEPASFFYKLL